MVGMDRGRKMGRYLVAAAAFATVAGQAVVLAQGPRGNRTLARGASPTQQPAEPASRLQQAETPRFEEKAIPVNPTDPIAIVNNEAITRQRLADECVARKGKEILDTLIARLLIEQAMKASKIEVTAAEIDQEIEDTAQRMAGVNREIWLRTLDKERGISPVQYARDIIYPTIALRKLATPRVQVTPQDIKDAMEANFGAKLHCRIIMTTSQRAAIDLWEQLKKNPGGFEKLARDHSQDKSTAALGGQLPEPIARHAHPRAVSDAAFQQLADGDLKDTDPSHKPKDGDVSGPIQVDEMAWVIIQREKLIPARPYDAKDPTLRALLHKQMSDANLAKAMTDLMNELLRNSAVDNRLTGRVKGKNEEQDPDYLSAKDTQVKLMGGQSDNSTPPQKGRANTGGMGAPGSNSGESNGSLQRQSPPSGVSPDVANQAERFKRSYESPAK